jgi:hypothetical protein
MTCCESMCIICNDSNAGKTVVTIIHSPDPDHNQCICSDCWVRYMNDRQNIDGTNEYGIRPMMCPHCSGVINEFGDGQFPIIEFSTCHFYATFTLNGNTRVNMQMQNGMPVAHILDKLKHQYDPSLHQFLDLYIENRHLERDSVIDASDIMEDSIIDVRINISD